MEGVGVGIRGKWWGESEGGGGGVGREIWDSEYG